MVKHKIGLWTSQIFRIALRLRWIVLDKVEAVPATRRTHELFPQVLRHVLLATLINRKVEINQISNVPKLQV